MYDASLALISEIQEQTGCPEIEHRSPGPALQFSPELGGSRLVPHHSVRGLRTVYRGSQPASLQSWSRWDAPSPHVLPRTQFCLLPKL